MFLPLSFSIILQIITISCIQKGGNKLIMAKDSQIDPKDVRVDKAHGGQTLTDEEGKNHNLTHKKQSNDRHKPGSDM